MENQNNRQNNNQNRDNNDGFMNKVGQTIENVVDTITGDNDNNQNQQPGKNKR
nr:hypothetical protein [Fredinandcohnia onubensis]